MGSMLMARVAPSPTSAGSVRSLSTPSAGITPSDPGCVAPRAMAQSSKLRSLVAVRRRAHEPASRPDWRRYPARLILLRRVQDGDEAQCRWRRRQRQATDL
jgi:hypothetical protein